VTELWFVDGADYLGTVIVRHRLTPALERAGGHIGYHVVPGRRRRGHATQMLAQAKLVCQELGLSEILVTCAEDNLGSRRVIEANGGALDGWLTAKPCTGGDLSAGHLSRCRIAGKLAFRSASKATITLVTTFSTNSRPALRAAASGGRPRPAGPPSANRGLNRGASTDTQVDRGRPTTLIQPLTHFRNTHGY
jgi:GNAT superfamily N-acetyltransferase